MTVPSYKISTLTSRVLTIRFPHLPLLFECCVAKCYKSGMNQFRGVIKKFTKATKWRYFWPVLVASVLVTAGTSSALYAHSGHYQTAITTPKTPQIVVVKQETTASAQPIATQATPAAEQSTATTPAATSSSSANNSVKKSTSNSTPAQTA